VLTLSSHDSICCLMSQFFGLWRQELLTLVHNISGNHTKGQLCWTKVSMTEHQTSRSLPKVWPWASGSLLDTPAGGNPLLRISQSRLPCADPLDYLSVPVFLGQDFPITVSDQLWPHSTS
jgi:hypothetical protein